MSRKLGFAGLISVLMMLSIVPSHAGGSANRMYVATPGFSYSPADTPVGIGGYQFETPTKLLTLDVDDLNGNGVQVSVCQENTSNPPDDLANVCGGEGDDVDITYCTSGSPKSLGAQNFKPNSNITVFVITQGAANGCSQVALGGSITWSW